MNSADTMQRGKTGDGVVTFEDGWPVIQKGVDKLIGLLEGLHTDRVTSEEYMHIYHITYELCNRKSREEPRLYDQYKQTYEDYIISKVLPSLRAKKDENLLQELVKRWNNHKLLTKWFSGCMHYLDRFFLMRKALPTLTQAAHLTFYKLVYEELNDRIRGAVISMINREREGEVIDQELVKNVLNIYVEVRDDSLEYFERDFEETFLKDTAAFYSSKAAEWRTSLSHHDYTLKEEEFLNKEKDRLSYYMKFASKFNITEEILRHEFQASKFEETK